MPDTTPILSLPVLVPNQAQPYVTHNGALRRLDLLVQLSVAGFGTETPPALPEEGEIHALGAAPTAAWAGHPLALAAWIDGDWLFIDPQEGWRAWGRAEAELRVWDGSGWAIPPADLDNVAGLGIGTGHDATNRLSVRAAATLLSHDGAGHQLKINKAGAGDTASLLFQSGWSGHAEMGLAGSTDWSLKVSPDGSAWTEALVVDAATGLLGGAAVQANATDTTAGKLPLLGNDASFSRLGVGTASPGTEVHVLGTLRIQKPTANNSLPTISSATAAYFDHVNTAAAKNCLVSILATNNGVSVLNFGDQDDEDAGRINYSHGSDRMEFYTATAERMRISSDGNVGINNSATSLARLRVTDPGSTLTTMLINNDSASYSGDMLQIETDTPGGSGFEFLTCWSNAFSDAEFRVRGDGQVTADGAFTGGGADYAEYFEWLDGNPGAEDRVGLSVVLDGGQIRPAQAGETPVGVISAMPSAVGDGDIDRWKGKYLRDDFGRYLVDTYEAVEWIEIVAVPGEEGGGSREIRHSYAADALPEGVTVPEAALRRPQQRRVLNPAYDPGQPYVSRAERPEWDMVGLLGKLRLRTGQPVAPGWIKLRDVSAGVEEWLVR